MALNYYIIVNYLFYTIVIIQ